MKKNSRLYCFVTVFSLFALLLVCLSPLNNDSFPVQRHTVTLEAPPVERIQQEPEKKPVAVPWQMQFLPMKEAYLNAHDQKVNGIAVGYFIPQREVNGVSLALMHAYNEHKRGVSMSLLEYSGESSGVTMFIAGGMRRNNGFSMGLLNMTESNNGLQLGIINQEECNLLFDYDMKPAEEDERFGVQAGLINYSDAPGIQFGLWNTNPRSWIKHFPLINFSF
jgi:hypothetical protein